MLNILISGACGKMGKMVADTVREKEDLTVVCGVDIMGGKCEFPVYKSFDEVTEKIDVIIDFSASTALDGILDFAKRKKIPTVLCSTGYKDAQIKEIEAASKEIAVFRSFNMSLGVNLLCSLVKKAANILGDGFDVEIIEKHHNQKIDAPSGTAIMLADAVNSQSEGIMNFEYDRHTKRAKRTKNEIGIHSVRGGTIVGEHDVIFAGNDEVITLSHSAQSRKIFANGAILAAKFIAGKNDGLYNMDDVFNF